MILGITGGIVYWQTHKKKIIREELESAIEKKSGGFYTIEYDNLELDEISGYLSATNLTLTYDSLKFAALQDLDLIPSVLLKIHVPEITVSGVKTPQVLIDKEIDGNKLEIKNPSIEIIYTKQGKDSARNVPAGDIYRQILGNLQKISIDTALITGAKITTYNLKEKHKGIELNNVFLQLIDVQVDSAANADETRLLFSRQIIAGFESFTLGSDNKLYKYAVRNLSLNSADQTARIGFFTVDPQAGEDAFVKSLPTQDDRFDFSLQDIVITGLDFPQLLNEKIIAENMTIGSASFRVYRDLIIPRDKKNRVGQYPHQLLAKIPIPLYIKKTRFNNTYVEYKERNHLTRKSGKVAFHDVSTTITNLTNDKEQIAKNNIMTVDINSRFMNQTPFKVSWRFYLGKANGRFQLKGDLGAINAKNLNPLTEPMGPARIEDGQVRGLQFNFSGNDYSMNGNMRLLYDDLKVALLEKDKGAKEWDKKSLTSFVANLLIKNSNPKDEDEAPRDVTVTNDRDTNRSIFNAAWKTIFKGIQETIGVKKKKQATQ